MPSIRKKGKISFINYRLRMIELSLKYKLSKKSSFKAKNIISTNIHVYPSLFLKLLSRQKLISS